MDESIESKSLAAWRHEIKVIGPRHYLVMYEAFMGTRVSNIPVFMRARTNYGDWYLFEAILKSSTQKLTGDPLAYVLKVASSLWKEDQLAEDAKDKEKELVEQSLNKTKQENLLLNRRLKIAQKNKRKLDR